MIMLLMSFKERYIFLVIAITLFTILVLATNIYYLLETIQVVFSTFLNVDDDGLDGIDEVVDFVVIHPYCLVI